MDRLDTMRAFAAVAQEGGFARAAERLGLSPQLVSKYVAHLEQQLNTRLLQRSTRKVQLTEAGRACLARCQQILIDVEDMELALGALATEARGTLRISAPMSFGVRHLAPALVTFQERFPRVAIDLQLNDRKVDLVDEGFDIALRVGTLKSSSLVARKLAEVRLVACASPAYLAAHGTPRKLEDLVRHRYLRYSYGDVTLSEMETGLSLNTLPCAFEANNGDVLLNAAIAGAGIVVQPTFIAGEALAAGQLVHILRELEMTSLGLYALYTHRQFLSHKVRSFIQFLEHYFGSPPYWDNF